jgi:hypothetical protein
MIACLLELLIKHRIYGEEAMEKMNILLQGHDEMLAGLKEFLCSHNHLQTSSKNFYYPLSNVDIMNFAHKVMVCLFFKKILNKLKDKFYMTAIRLMMMYSAEY